PPVPPPLLLHEAAPPLPPSARLFSMVVLPWSVSVLLDHTPPPAASAPGWPLTCLLVPAAPLLPRASLFWAVTPDRGSSPWLYTVPASAELPEPNARPFCRVRFCRVSEPPMATSKSRKSAVPEAVLRSIVSPLPTMVSVSFLAMTGRPVEPSVLLFTAV